MARESFQFQFGTEIHVISDKAYRLSSQNKFKAIGNVIIKHLQNSVYGEKAEMSFDSGDVEVEGNVRYIGPEMTIYGSKLFYNFKNQTLVIENARVISKRYTVIGKKLSKVSEGVFVGEEAEYSTCRDCPESWSIYGEKIHITEDEYIRIRHGYLKVKGVVAFYLPYIVFPIKKERETGLLFPQIEFNYADGIRYQQPFYFVTGDQNDITFTPSTWGKRGLGGELELRHFFSENNWMVADSIFANDRVYEPFKEELNLASEKTFRQFSTYEHHFSKGLWFNHHVSIKDNSDLDLTRDFDFYTGRKISGPEVKSEGFFDFRHPNLSLSVYSGVAQNNLYELPKEFDNRYVQILPEVSMSYAPYRLWWSKDFFIRSGYFGLDSTWTNFKQNHLHEGQYIRNAKRYDVKPNLTLNFRKIGPVAFKTDVKFDYQAYQFPYLEEQKTFSKGGLLYESEANFEIDKVFGVSYKEVLDKSEVNEEDNKKEKNKEKVSFSKANLISGIEEFVPNKAATKVEITSNSYRHRQIFRLKHYYLSNTKTQGNDLFLEQIQDTSGAGRFDRLDSIRRREFEINQGPTISLPLANTVELKWENSVVQKKAKRIGREAYSGRLIDNFDYTRVGYFNISQGYNLYEESEELRERLTRLYINSGVSVSKFKFNASEYYFHSTQDHIFHADVKYVEPYFELSLGYNYDTQIQPIRKTVEVGGIIRIMDLYSLGTKYEYDIEKERVPQSSYQLIYSPRNDCWKLDVKYTQNIIEKRLAFNILIRFNDKGFNSLSDIY
ncbi:MAG: LPS-assembly protein LptD [Bacteriovoracaceae bacterium]